MTQKDSNHYWMRSGFWTLAEKAVGLAFNLGASMLLLRLLSKSDFAGWGVFIVITYFMEMGRSGLIQNGLVRSLAVNRDNPEEQARVQTSALMLNLAFSVVSSLFIACIWRFLATTYHAPQLAQVIPVYYLINFMMVGFYHFNFVQQAHFEFRGIFWSTFFYRGAVFSWLFYCWSYKVPVDMAVLAVVMAVGAFLGMGASWVYARKFLQFSKQISTRSLSDLISFGKYVLGTNLSTMFYKNIDKLTLGHLIGPAAFAVYDAASKITQMVEAPSFSIAAVVFPQSALRAETEGSAGVKRLYERSVGAILAIIIPFLVLALIFAEKLVLLFAGPAYIDSAGVLRLTAFFGLFMPFAVQFGTILDSTGKPALNFGYTFFTAILNLGMSYLFVWQFGLMGAAYATLTSYLISFVLMQQLLRRKYGIQWWKAFGYIPEFYATALGIFQKYTQKAPAN